MQYDTHYALANQRKLHLHRMQKYLAAQGLFLLIVFLARSPEINLHRKLPQLTVQVVPSGKPGINGGKWNP